MKEYLDKYKGIMLSLIEEARQFRFSVAPNPCVGSALLYDNTIVARGYHEKYGNHHAEINCIENAKRKDVDITKCTLIVTLEPCCHYGKTPPCVERIINEGIKRVVVAVKDPTSSGGGIDLLRNKGIEVVEGICKKEALQLLSDFIVWNRTDIPVVILKLATTLDGYIATPSGESRWITNELSREYVQELRKNIGENNGAILVGGETVRVDNPHLYSKKKEVKQQPYPLVYTSSLLGMRESYLYSTRRDELIICTTKNTMESEEAKKMLQEGGTLWALDEDIAGLSLLQGLQRARNEKDSFFILCEGGGKLAFSLLRAGIPLELQLFYAPRIFADNSSYPSFSGNRISSLENAYSLEFCSARTFSSDVLLSYHTMELASLCRTCE